MKKIIFLNSHPIQYFAPLYAFLSKNALNIEAWYCSSPTLVNIDKGFGVKVKWDIPLLDGYQSRFFRNHSKKRGDVTSSFLGIINLGLFRALVKERKAFLVVPGWQFVSYLVAIIWGKFCGHSICLRCEMPLKQELLKKGLSNKIKLLVLRFFVFRFVDHFLYIGSQNKAFYRSLGVPENKMHFTPYAVDNDRLQASAKLYKGQQKTNLRAALNIPSDAQVILYCGKYISKKRPNDLLRAFNKMQISNTFLLMVGEGELRGEMEQYINQHGLQERVLLTGFINQTDLVKYYSVADIFVMCSDIGETWGLSVNEAMNYGLPIVVSDMIGSAEDLVAEGKNGFTYASGDIETLSAKLVQALSDDEFRTSATQYSLEIVNRYSYSQIYAGLIDLIGSEAVFLTPEILTTTSELRSRSMEKVS